MLAGGVGSVGAQNRREATRLTWDHSEGIVLLAKTNFSFAKRQREMAKKQRKAETKQRKAEGGSANDPTVDEFGMPIDPEAQTAEGESEGQAAEGESEAQPATGEPEPQSGG